MYPDRESFFSDLKKIYQQEIADLAKEGCTYLQLDDTALPCNCDVKAMNDVYKKLMPDPKPARATVQVAGLIGGAKIEISAIAVKRQPVLRDAQ